MKLLLYCTKAKPNLNCDYGKNNHEEYSGDWNIYLANKQNECSNIVNGKIVAECDFEVEDLRIVDDDPLGAYWYETKTLSENEVLEKSYLTGDELFDYLGEDNEGYAIHIKNLHIFDKPRELDFYSSNFDYFKKVEKAPQNMMKVWEDQESPRVLISIRPEWLCKILNGEKTIEVRKKVLKEMLK